jgi:NAD(P)-dependent dehydrogenase (short-subunit alcohol dehydrogenase family)
MKTKLIINLIASLCFKWKFTQFSNDAGTSTKESKYYPEFERTEIPNLNGKVVVITGCTSGMGLVAAKCTARKGAKAVIMLNRLSKRATAAEDIVKAQVSKDSTPTNPTIVETISCDLQDFASVQEAIRIIKSKYDKIDVLCNNAGVMNLDDIATKDGYDIQIQTNHLSHFLLTKELFSLIQKSNDGRVVNHSSLARKGKPLQSQYFDKNGGNLGGDAGKFERYVIYLCHTIQQKFVKS